MPGPTTRPQFNIFRKAAVFLRARKLVKLADFFEDAGKATADSLEALKALKKAKKALPNAPDAPNANVPAYDAANASELSASRRTVPSLEPSPNATARGVRERLPAADRATENILSNELQDNAAHHLARQGYNVERLPKSGAGKNPDFRIEGREFDHMSVTSPRSRNIWTRMLDEKIASGQASRIILDTRLSSVSIADLRKQFTDFPMPGLDEVIVIGKGGTITHLWP